MPEMLGGTIQILRSLLPHHLPLTMATTLLLKALGGTIQILWSLLLTPKAPRGTVQILWSLHPTLCGTVQIFRSLRNPPLAINYGHNPTAAHGHGTTAAHGHGTNPTNSDSDQSMHDNEPTCARHQHHVTQSDSEDYSIRNNTSCPQQLTSLMQMHPDGSLLSHFPCLTSTSNNNAEHILLWLEIMDDGPITFERKIARNLQHTKMAPALFAILPEWSETVKLAHGFSSMLLTNCDHWVDGKVGFFLGDRIAIPLTIGQRLQDPQLVLAQSFQTLLTNYHGIPASEQRITCCATMPVPASTKGSTVTLHKLFPILQSWWPFFLPGNRIPSDTLAFIASAM